MLNVFATAPAFSPGCNKTRCTRSPGRRYVKYLRHYPGSPLRPRHSYFVAAPAALRIPAARAVQPRHPCRGVRGSHLRRSPLLCDKVQGGLLCCAVPASLEVRPGPPGRAFAVLAAHPVCPFAASRLTPVRHKEEHSRRLFPGPGFRRADKEFFNNSLSAASLLRPKKTTKASVRWSSRDELR